MIQRLLLRFLLVFLVSAPAQALDSVTERIGEIPIQHSGRVKPLDTYARVHLLAFSGKQSLGDIEAMSWLLELVSNPQHAYGREVFDIRNPAVAAALSLPERDGHRYPFRETYTALHEISEDLRTMHAKRAEERNLVETQLLELESSVYLYYEISRSLSCLLPDISMDSATLAESFGIPVGQRVSYRSLMSNTEAVRALAAAAEQAEDEAVLALADQLGRRYNDRSTRAMTLVPSATGAEEWETPWALLDGRELSIEQKQVLEAWEVLLDAYMRLDLTDLEGALTSLSTALETAGEQSGKSRQLEVEVLYNRLELFYKSAAFYVLAFLLLMVSWLFRPGLMQKLAFWALILGILPHACGLLLRMYIMGRPPVSTLYESIVFVGLVGALAGAIVERLQQNGLGAFVGSSLGAVLHFVGFGYAVEGDTLGMLVAVLNSNFWLATHVVTITIGYGAAFVSGMAGHVYLVQQALRPNDHERLSSIQRNMIGLTLVALFFTLFGTILGGIWADQSWGRFWGWDPKENGALLIVLWQLILLHGSLTRHFGPIGFAAGLVVNNVIVLIAWFGVNLLSVGLHSYGSTGNVARNLGAVCAAELLFALVMYFVARWRASDLVRVSHQIP